MYLNQFQILSRIIALFSLEKTFKIIERKHEQNLLQIKHLMYNSLLNLALLLLNQIVLSSYTEELKYCNKINFKSSLIHLND